MTLGSDARERDVATGQLLMLAVLALTCIGLVFVASTSASLSRPVVSSRIWATPLGRQGIMVILGCIVLVLTARVAGPWVLGSARRVRWCAWIALGACVAGLAAVLVPGVVPATHGSQRWLRVWVGGVDVGFQPSELAKPALIAWLAYWLVARRDDLASLWRGFAPAALVAGACIALVGIEDFGTAALLAAVAGGMLLIGGCRLVHLSTAALIGAVGFGVLLVSAPYRLDRLLAFRDPWADPGGLGYHSIQSLTTIASGGWFGRGLGAGIQKYGYLPESRTDFIFAIICEEAGVLGGLLVIGLFVVFVWAGLRAGVRAATPFERLLALGLTLTIGLQAAMNLAVVTVSAPTTGIPLPFISAGGSGMVVLGLAIGALVAVASRGMPPECAQRPEHPLAQVSRLPRRDGGTGVPPVKPVVSSHAAEGIQP